MRISKIKAFSDDYKVRGAISRFWEIEEYRKALETHNQEDCTIFDIYDIIVNTFINKYNCDQTTTKESSKERKYLKQLSKLLYNDINRWAIGTNWMEKIQAQENIKKQKIQNYVLLSPLYEKLGLTPIEKQFDIIHLISADFLLCDRVINLLAEINTREDLYEIVIEIVLHRIISGDYSYKDYFLLGRVSAVTYQVKKYWATSNGIPFEEVQKRFYNQPKSEKINLNRRTLDAMGKRNNCTHKQKCTHKL